MVLLATLGLPDLDRLRELLERIRDMIALGGMALALLVSGLFIVAWVFSHLRKPTLASPGRPALAVTALWSAYIPVALTVVAAAGALLPFFGPPFVLKVFAAAVLAAALSWCLAIAALVAGGPRRNLARARRALLLAGTPWYCLAAYLSTWL